VQYNLFKRQKAVYVLAKLKIYFCSYK